MAREAEHALQVENLTKRYGDLLAVNDISFNVRMGELFARLGPNGAGKTTTVEIIDTIRTPTSGNVTISFPMMFLSGSFFPLEMMPDFMQTLARILPLYDVNEGLRASMVFNDHIAALRYSPIIGVFAAVVFILGILATKWEEGT
jgi:ABC-type branched-subunit amino acid transport system ATPase component